MNNCLENSCICHEILRMNGNVIVLNLAISAQRTIKYELTESTDQRNFAEILKKTIDICQ